MIVDVMTLRIKVAICTLLFLFGAGWAHGQTTVKVMLHDSSEQSYSVEANGKLWFNSNSLVINTDNTGTEITIPLSDIRRITMEGTGGGTGINEVVKSQENIRIYPNPASSYFEVEASGHEKLNVRIFNTNGTLVASDTYTSGSRVNIAHLTTGIYVVVVNNQSFKLIKQ